MPNLLDEFLANLFNSYYHFDKLSDQPFDYDSIYTKNPNKEDDITSEDPSKYGITKHYTNDDEKNLICIEYHYGQDYESEFEFTIAGYERYKKLVLEYINSKIDKYYNEIKNKEFMQAFKESETEWAEVYTRLADS